MSPSALAANGTIFLANTWGEPDMTGGRGAEFGKASPIGLFLILALLIAVVLLVRSMNRRLRNLPESFDEPAPTAGAAAGARKAGVPLDDALPGQRAEESGATLVKEADRPDADGVDLQK